MKVYELVAILLKRPAGDEVVVSLASTANAPIETVDCSENGLVQINGEAAMIYDTNGDEYCLTNEIEPDSD